MTTLFRHRHYDLSRCNYFCCTENVGKQIGNSNKYRWRITIGSGEAASGECQRTTAEGHVRSKCRRKYCRRTRRYEEDILHAITSINNRRFQVILIISSRHQFPIDTSTNRYIIIFCSLSILLFLEISSINFRPKINFESSHYISKILTWHQCQFTYKTISGRNRKYVTWRSRQAVLFLSLRLAILLLPLGFGEKFHVSISSLRSKDASTRNKMKIKKSW